MSTSARSESLARMDRAVAVLERTRRFVEDQPHAQRSHDGDVGLAVYQFEMARKLQQSVSHLGTSLYFAATAVEPLLAELESLCEVAERPAGETGRDTRARAVADALALLRSDAEALCVAAVNCMSQSPSADALDEMDACIVHVERSCAAAGRALGSIGRMGEQ